jgi:hypothetical protein
MDYSEQKDTKQGMLTNGQRFLGNRHDAFSVNLSKKAEKLSTAIYMVTSFLDDREPLKQSFRELGLALVKDSIKVSVKGQYETTAVFERLSDTLRELMALTELATSVSLLSDMNGMILMKEFRALDQKISDKHAVLFTLPESLFKSETVEQQVPQLRTEERMSQSQFQRPMTAVKDTPKVQVQSPKPVLKVTIGNEDIARNARRNNILQIVKDKKEVTIKDIGMIVSEYSDKTIQRELATLVASGVLKKVGEKRWSKYILVR